MTRRQMRHSVSRYNSNSGGRYDRGQGASGARDIQIELTVSPRLLAVLCAVPATFTDEPPARKPKLAAVRAEVTHAAALAASLECAEGENAINEATAAAAAARSKLSAQPPTPAVSAAAAAAAASSSVAVAVPVVSEDVSRWSGAARSYRDQIASLHGRVRDELQSNSDVEAQVQAALADVDLWRTRAEESANNGHHLAIVYSCMLVDSGRTASPSAAAAAATPAWHVTRAAPSIQLSAAAAPAAAHTDDAAHAPAIEESESFPALPLELAIAPAEEPADGAESAGWSHMSHSFRVEIAALEAYLTAGREFNDKRREALQTALADAALWRDRAEQAASRNAQLALMTRCLQIEIQQSTEQTTTQKATTDKAGKKSK